MAKRQAPAVEPEPAPELQEAASTPEYSISLGIKTPSKNVQYRMLEAYVTIKSANYEDAQNDAVVALDQAIINLCEAWSEPFPEEVQARLDAAN